MWYAEPEGVLPIMRRLILSLTAALVLAGCVAPSQPYLDAARGACAAGDPNACDHIPGLQSQVIIEQQQQAQAVGAALLLGAVAGAAAYGAASYQPPVVIVCRHRWRC